MSLDTDLGSERWFERARYVFRMGKNVPARIVVWRYFLDVLMEKITGGEKPIAVVLPEMAFARLQEDFAWFEKYAFGVKLRLGAVPKVVLKRTTIPGLVQGGGPFWDKMVACGFFRPTIHELQEPADELLRRFVPVFAEADVERHEGI